MNYYVDYATGSNLNLGTSPAAPLQTIRFAITLLAPGDTLWIFTGTWTEYLDETLFTASGTPSGWITIRGDYNGPVTLNNNGYPEIIRHYSNTIRYIHYRDLTLNGGTYNGGLGLSFGGLNSYGNPASYYLKFTNIEIKDTWSNGAIGGGVGHQFINMNVHGCGRLPASVYPQGANGVYFTGDDSLFEGGDYWDNRGFGIRIADSWVAHRASNNVINRVRLYRNGPGKGLGGLSDTAGGGAVIGDTNNKIQNSYIFDNAYGVQVMALSGKRPSGVKVYFNTFGLNVSHAVDVGLFGGADGTDIRSNILSVRPGASPILYEEGVSGTIESNNVIEDPAFVDAAAFDLTLRSYSPAIGAGTNLGVDNDYFGNSRPTGGRFDAGAQQYGGSVDPRPIPPPIEPEGVPEPPTPTEGAGGGGVPPTPPAPGSSSSLLSPKNQQSFVKGAAGSANVFDYTVDSSTQPIYMVLGIGFNKTVSSITFGAQSFRKLWESVVTAVTGFKLQVWGLDNPVVGEDDVTITSDAPCAGGAFQVEGGPEIATIILPGSRMNTPASLAASVTGASFSTEGLVVGFAYNHAGKTWYTDDGNELWANFGVGTYFSACATLPGSADFTTFNWLLGATSCESGTMVFTIPVPAALSGGTKQVVPGRIYSSVGSFGLALPRSLMSAGLESDSVEDSKILANCTLRTLSYELDTDPGAATVTFTVYENGQATPNTVSVTGTTRLAELNVDIGMYKYSTWAVLCTVSSGSMGFSYCYEFELATAGESIYGSCRMNFLSHNAKKGLLSPMNNNWSTFPAIEESIVCHDGPMLEMLAEYQTELSSGQQIDFVVVLVRGGVHTPQDGTGGTVNTTVSLIGGNGNGHNGQSMGRSLFTLPLVKGDRVYAKCIIISGSPGLRGGIACRMAADRVGEFSLSGVARSSPHQTAVRYSGPTGSYDGSMTGWQTTEAEAKVRVRVSTPLVVKGFILQSTNSVGAAPNQYLFEVLKNGAVIAASPVAALTTGLFETEDDGLINYITGDYVSERVTPTSVPDDIGTNYFGLTGYMLPAEGPAPPVPSSQPRDAVPCCDNRGPSGTSPVTQPSGGPGTVVPPIVLIPVVIPPGGADPPTTYTPCEGGGTMTAGSDPTEGMTFTGGAPKTPLISIVWELEDTTVIRKAKLPINTPARAPIDAGILAFSPVTYSLADRKGNIRMQTMSITLNDNSGSLREMLAVGSNRFIVGRRITAYIEDNVDRIAGNPQHQLVSGLISSDPDFDEEASITIPLADELGYRYSPISIDRRFPSRTLRPEMFPNLPVQFAGIAVPIIYGEYSDEHRVAFNPPEVPYGITPTLFVGTRMLTKVLGGDPEEWDAFLVCGHAIKSIHAWFASNLAVDSAAYGSVRMDPTTASVGGEFLIPGYGNWDQYFTTPYTDLTDSNGITERYTIIYAKGGRSDDAVSGGVPITLNVCAIEDVGDGSGNVVTDISYQIAHFINAWILNEYETGLWPAVPTVSGVPRIRMSSVVAVKAIHDARLTGGYPGAWGLWEQATGRDILSDLQISGDIRLGFNNYGQIVEFTLNERQDLSALPTVSDVEKHMNEGTFKVRKLTDEVENYLPYSFGPEAATGRVTGAKQRIVSITSIDNYRSKRDAPDVLLRATRNRAMADNVMMRAILWSRESPTYVSWDGTLEMMKFHVGQLVQLKHKRGIGQYGWTNRLLLITSITPNPEESDFSVSMTAEDVHNMLVRLNVDGSTPSGTLISGIGFHPMGDSGTGTTMGTSTTGYRMG